MSKRREKKNQISARSFTTDYETNEHNIDTFEKKNVLRNKKKKMSNMILCA